MSVVEVRKALAGEAPALAALDRRCFDAPWAESMYRAELVSSRARVEVATEERRLVGLSVSWRVADEVHLLRIAVEPGSRGRGLGRDLLERVIGRARDAAAVGVLLEVGASNEPALALYRALGFGVVGRRRGYYTRPPDDAILMTLRLN